MEGGTPRGWKFIDDKLGFIISRRQFWCVLVNGANGNTKGGDNMDQHYDKSFSSIPSEFSESEKSGKNHLSQNRYVSKYLPSFREEKKHPATDTDKAIETRQTTQRATGLGKERNEANGYASPHEHVFRTYHNTATRETMDFMDLRFAGPLRFIDKPDGR